MKNGSEIVSSEKEANEQSGEESDPKVLLIEGLNTRFSHFIEEQSEVLRLLERSIESSERIDQRISKMKTDFESKINGGIDDEPLIEAFENLIVAAGGAQDGNQKDAIIAALESVNESVLPEHENAYLGSLIRNLGRMPSEHTYLFPGFLTMLVSQIEVIIRSYAEEVSKAFPSMMLGGDESISLKDLSKFTTVEEAKTYLLQSKIDNVLRGSLSDWVKFFVDKMKINPNMVASTPEVIEVTQRRHCFIHNDGRASQPYLVNTKNADVELGDYLSVSPRYVRKAADLLLVFMLSLHVSLAEKMAGKNKEAKESLSRFVGIVSFSLLQDRRYGTLKLISKSLPALRIEDSDQNILDVNIWLAYKFTNEFEAVREQVESLDTDVIPISLRLAKAALLDEHEGALKLIEAMLLTGDIEKEHILTWPLLRNVYPMYKAKHSK